MSQDKSEKVTEFTYELEEPIKYAHKGSPVEASFILFKAPSSKQIDLCSDLKQFFFQALKDGEESSAGRTVGESDKDLDLTGSDIMSLIAMSTKVKLKAVILTAKLLFKVNGIALVDGQTSINDIMMNDMHPDTLEDMVGEYLVNFILASVLKRMKRDLSDSAAT